jgi:cytoskeleton protein RodZ
MVKKKKAELVECTYGLGHKLKLAREAKKLSVEKVSKQLFLNQQRIIDIEADDYSRISSPLFIRGYLRSYAKLLGIPEEEINEDIDKLDFNLPASLADSSMITYTPKQNLSPRFRRCFRWINIGLVVLVIILVLVWWNGRKIPGNVETVTDDSITQQLVVPPAESQSTVLPTPKPDDIPKPKHKSAPKKSTVEQPAESTVAEQTPPATEQADSSTTNNNPPAESQSQNE